MLQIEPVKAFQDNYIWLISAPGSNNAFVVDPGDANPVISALQDAGKTLVGILITHHLPYFAITISIQSQEKI